MNDPMSCLSQAAAVVAAHFGASMRHRPAHVRQSVAHRRQEDVAAGEPGGRSGAYQAVDYTNKNKKGPALVVLPGEIKSNNATFLQKFTANNIADFGEMELSSANFPVLERSNLGQRSGILACLQPRRSGLGAQDPADGQAQERPSTS